MRIFALLILALFAGGAIWLSIYAQREIEASAKYGNDDLVRAIRIHNEINKGQATTNDYMQNKRPDTKQVIQYGGGVAVMQRTDTGDVRAKPGGNTYYGSAADVPSTNEGQPGQPLPLTSPPPINPVYR